MSSDFDAENMSKVVINSIQRGHQFVSVKKTATKIMTSKAMVDGSSMSYHPLGVIHKDTIMAQQVLLPRFHRRLTILHSKCFHFLNIRLFLNSIQILVQPIEQVLTKLLTVMLIIIIELWCIHRNGLLERSGCQDWKVTGIYLIQEVSVCRSDTSTGTQGISLLNVLDVITLQEVLGDGFDMINALQDRILEN